MAVLLNFEDEPSDDSVRAEPAAGSSGPCMARDKTVGAPDPALVVSAAAAGIDAERPNPNLNVVSEALGCYPSALTSHLRFPLTQNLEAPLPTLLALRRRAGIRGLETLT